MVKVSKSNRLFVVITSVLLLLSIVFTLSFDVLYPSAISWYTVTAGETFKERVWSHDYQFIDDNCNFRNITNNYTDFTTNFSYGSGFGFYINAPSNSEGQYVNGIFYDGRLLSAGKNTLSGSVTFCIPNGAIKHEGVTSFNSSNPNASEIPIKYYDVKVVISDIVVDSLDGYSNAGQSASSVSGWGTPANGLFGNGSTESDEHWHKSNLVRICNSGGFSSAVSSGSTGGSDKIGLWAYGLGHDIGFACNVTISIINHTDDGSWRSAATVSSGTIPMMYDDIDIEDRYTWRIIKRDKDSNSTALNAYNKALSLEEYYLPYYTGGSWSSGAAFTAALHDPDMGSFGSTYSTYNGPYAESIEFKDGLTLYDGNPLVWIKENSTLHFINNRVVGTVENNTNEDKACVVYLADASGSTIRWTGSTCFTWLFSNIGYYNLTIRRDDSYGIDGGTVRWYRNYGNNSVTGSRGNVFAHNDDAVWATANDGYYIKAVKVDGTSETVTDDTWYQKTFTDITANHTVVVTLGKFSKITTEVEHGDITPTVTDIKEGENKTITYTADPGYYLESVTVDGESKSISSYATSYSFNNITGDHTIKVVYAPCYKITTSATHGDITPTVTGIKAGENKTITYSPHSGYYLESVTVDGSPKSISDYSGSYAFNNINADHTIDVVYAPYFKIETSVTHGTITNPISNIKKGETYTITYSADPGYYLESVKVDGTFLSVDAYATSYKFSNISADHKIEVVYAPYFKIETSVTYGKIDPPVYNIKKGESVTINYEPDEGYLLKSVTVDGSSKSISTYKDSYTFSNISADHKIDVVYELAKSVLTVTKTVPSGFSAQGAVYTVYNNSACTSVIGNITIGSNGKGTFSWVTIDNCYKNNGRYYVWVKETREPSQALPADVYWLMDETAHQVEVVLGTDVGITSQNRVKYCYGYVQVHKTVAPAYNSTAYAPTGATYNVYASQSTSGTLLGTVTIKSNGYSETLKISWPKSDNGKTVYVREASQPTTALPADVYWITDDTWHTLYVSSDGTKPGDTVVTDSENSIKYCYGYVNVNKKATPAWDNSTTYASTGAVYKIYSNPSTGSTLLGTVTIGANGYCSDFKIAWGKNETGKTVYIKEYSPPTTKLPDDVYWVMDNTWHTAYISSDGTKPGDTITVESRNTLKYCYGYVQVHKSPTPAYDNSVTYAPTGAVYRIYSSPSTGSTNIGSLTVGSNEYSATFKIAWPEDEFEKTVYIKEYSPPTTSLPADVYWVMDNTWYTAYVHSDGSRPGDVVIANSENTLKYCYGYVQVHKLVTPSYDGSVNYASNGAVYKAYEDAYTSSKLVGNMTIGSNDHSGLLKVSWPKADDGKTVYVKEYSPPTTKLPADVYWVMDNNWYIAHVTSDGHAPGDVVVVTSSNELKYCYAFVQVNVDVSPAYDDPATYLPTNAVYRVYSSMSTSGTPLGELKVTSDGTSNVLRISWPEADYGKTVYIKQYSPPTTGLPDDVYWVMDNEWYVAETYSDGSAPGDVVVVNSIDTLKYCYGYVSVYKWLEPAEAEYLEGDYSPAGAVYGVYSNNACTTLLGSVTIKADGFSDSFRINWAETANGKTVYVKEISPPTIVAGTSISYTWGMDDTVYRLDVANEDNTKASSTFTAYSQDGITEYGYFQIQKTTDSGSVNVVDGNSLYTLAGTKFRVKGLAGTDVESYDATFTTDADGFTPLTKVKIGTYIVTEVTPPSGYLNNTDSLTNTYVFEVHLNNIQGNPIVTVFENVPASASSQIEIDKDWAEP